MKKIFISLAALLFFASPLALLADEKAPSVTKKEHVSVGLLSEDKAIAPGSSFWVAIRLDMAEGWETYWMNPGDAGIPTTVEWHLPPGFEAGPILWPYPKKFISESMVGFGYSDSAVLLAEIKAPKNLSAGESLELSADVSYLACHESCVPGSAHVTLMLPVASTVVIDQQNSPLFAEARQSLPQSLTSGQMSATTQGEEILLTFDPSLLEAKKVAQASFFPQEEGIINYLSKQSLVEKEGKYTLHLTKASSPKLSKEIKGVVHLIGEDGKNLAYNIALPLNGAASSHGSLSFQLALGFAFLGGLILNVMPCVLPVVALKIFSFVKMGQERRGEILKHGGAFTMGVVLSFWVLSGLLLILRSYGEGVGWGFHLQEPAFIVILALVIFLLGLSLFGVFEVGTSFLSLAQKKPTSTKPLLGSFFSGILATLVATPCTGPLLGPAVGFAVTLPPFNSMMVFTAMGLGMASPYLLFSAFPALVRFLPKPGNWMVVFKQLMGFLMMGTVVWLVWVFSAVSDNAALFALLGTLVFCAFGGWLFGKFATPIRKKSTRLLATAVALGIILLGGFFAVQVANQHKVKEGAATEWVHETGWEVYSPERVAELQAQGTPVFVDFTAKWCLICQANKLVLHKEDVETAFKEAGVVKMVADWTKKDAIITQELEKMGRSGVPLYLLYPGKPEASPAILPQTLTSAIVIDQIHQLPSSHVH